MTQFVKKPKYDETPTR